MYLQHCWWYWNLFSVAATVAAVAVPYTTLLHCPHGRQCFSMLLCLLLQLVLTIYCVSIKRLFWSALLWCRSPCSSFSNESDGGALSKVVAVKLGGKLNLVKIITIILRVHYSTILIVMTMKTIAATTQRLTVTNLARQCDCQSFKLGHNNQCPLCKHGILGTWVLGRHFHMILVACVWLVHEHI